MIFFESEQVIKLHSSLIAKTGWSLLRENQTPQIIELQEKLSKYDCSVFSRTQDLGNRQK